MQESIEVNQFNLNGVPSNFKFVKLIRIIYFPFLIYAGFIFPIIISYEHYNLGFELCVDFMALIYIATKIVHIETVKIK
jgi:hypothetical protein